MHWEDGKNSKNFAQRVKTGLGRLFFGLLFIASLIFSKQALDHYLEERTTFEISHQILLFLVSIKIHYFVFFIFVPEVLSVVSNNNL